MIPQRNHFETTPGGKGEFFIRTPDFYDRMPIKLVFNSVPLLSEKVLIFHQFPDFGE